MVQILSSGQEPSALSGDPLEQSIARWTSDSINRLGHDPETARSLARVALRFVRDSGCRTFSDLKPLTLMNWLAADAVRLRPRTIRNRLAAIRQWGRFLSAVGLIDSPPFESVRSQRCISDDGCDAITSDQVEDLLRIARSDSFSPCWQTRWNAPSRYVAYLLMTDVGFRVGEVRNQEWRDVNTVERTIRISRDKSRRNDVVELSKRATAALRWLRMRQRSEGGVGRLVMRSGPNAKKLREDLDRIGCSGQPGRFHRLRKYAITKRAAEGWDIWSLTYFARHRDPKTTMRYVRPPSGVRNSVLPNLSP